MTGYISYLIPCSGTLVAVDATGFCTFQKTHQEVSLAILLNPKDDTQPVHLIKADCDFTNISSLSDGMDYSFGSVSHNDLNIPVTSDEVLTIGLYTRCTGRSCYFQPAVINDISKHMLFFLEDGKPVNETVILSNVSLLFSATIEISNGKQGKYIVNSVSLGDLHFLD